MFKLVAGAPKIAEAIYAGASYALNANQKTGGDTT
jgi:hypothetical protein